MSLGKVLVLTVAAIATVAVAKRIPFNGIRGRRRRKIQEPEECTVVSRSAPHPAPAESVNGVSNVTTPMPSSPNANKADACSQVTESSGSSNGDVALPSQTHAVHPRSPVSDHSQELTKPRLAPLDKICFFHRKSNCRYGQDGRGCRFVHGVLCVFCGENAVHPHNAEAAEVHYASCHVRVLASHAHIAHAHHIPAAGVGGPANWTELDDQDCRTARANGNFSNRSRGTRRPRAGRRGRGRERRDATK